jgi:hypothetical protein
VKSILSKLSAILFTCLFTFAPILAHAQNSPFANWSKPLNIDPLDALKKLPADQAKALKEKALAELKAQHDIKSTPYSEIKTAFDLKAHAVTQRVLKGGGGVVDGGGGNLSSQNGEMFDRYQYNNLEKLETVELKDLVRKYYDSRIQMIESEAPGFKNWLELAFKKPWFLVVLPFEKSICPIADQGTCQTADAVHLNREIYNKASEAKRAEMILSELFMRSIREVTAEKKNPILSEIKKRFLNENVRPKQFFDYLVQADLVYSPAIAEATRVRFVSEYEAQLAPLKKTIAEFLVTCQQMPMDFSRSFYKSVNQYMDYAKRCNQWLRTDVDGQSCEIDSIAEIVVAFKVSNCVKP